MNQFIIDQINYYSPNFLVKSIKYVRIDTGCYVYDIEAYNTSSEAIKLSWYGVVINAFVLGNRVSHYRLFIPESLYTSWK